MTIFIYFLVLLSFTISSLFANDNQYRTIQVPVDVDHFSFVNDDKFNITVLLNDSYWRDPVNGPIFAYFGGISPIEISVHGAGYLWEVAAELEGLIVLIEHRYYGKSLPYGDKSSTEKKYFGYLTLEQALRDFIEVLFYIDSEKWRGTTIENPTTEIKHAIFAISGSYGGQLAAYSRIKYPHVITGTLASSAPIFYEYGLIECDSFRKTITKVFSMDYPECPNLVRKTWDALFNITEDGDSDEGKKWLEGAWKLCTPISSIVDVYYLIYWSVDQLESIALANYPYEHNYIMPLPPYPVKVFCAKMVETTEEPKDLVMSMFHALNLVVNHTGNVDCFGYNASNPTSDSSKVTQFDPWTLQGCMEIVTPACSDGIHEMYIEQEWNFTATSDYCYDQYKVRPRVNQMILEYGGRNLKAASHIIFSNGELDPWTGGVPNENLSPTVIAVVLPNCAHHLDLMASNEKDPKEVTEARKFYKITFQSWITEFREKGKSSYK